MLDAGRFPLRIPFDLFENGTYGGGLWLPQREVNGVQNLYQDAAGTIPVTADGDPVGLVIDRSQGYDRGVVNLLTYTEDFSNAAWSKSRITISEASDGWWEVRESGGVSIHILQVLSITPSAVCRYEVDVMADGRNYALFSSSQAGGLGINLQTGAVVDTIGSLSNVTVTPLAEGGYRIGFTHTASAGENFNVYCSQDGIFSNRNYTADIALGIKVRFPSLSKGVDSVDYQPKTNTLAEGGNHLIQEVAGSRPTYKTDGTYEWLLPDGIDDFMGTAGAVDMKASVSSSAFAAIRQPSNSGTPLVYIELSVSPPTTPGTTGLLGSNTSLPYYRHRGTADKYSTGTSVTPGTDVVVSGRGNIPGDILTLYQNGIQKGQNNSDQGTGTLVNAPVYAMGRGDGSFYMNQRVYGLMLISRYLDDGQMLATSNYFAGLRP